MPDSHDDPSLLERRKIDHLELCAREDVEYRERTTLLEQVTLLHDSLPELRVDDIDLSTRFLGRSLAAPFMISGMTGGAAQARDINRALASVAGELGLAFGVGSQRPMLRDPAQLESYRVRDVAPDVFLCGNLGAVQVAQTSTQEVEDLVGAIGADALCIHLNPGQEIVQDHGDRDFRGCLDAIARLVSELSIPVIAKETGCGMSPAVLDRLRDTGVRAVDVSGAGGTTWVGVETLRGSPGRRRVGETLWDWGIPTAASVAWASARRFDVIASGGLRDGLDAARAIALGATLASSALPWLRAYREAGRDGALRLGQHLIETLRAVLLLTGSPDLERLRTAPRIVGPTLERWIEQGDRPR